MNQNNLAEVPKTVRLRGRVPVHSPSYRPDRQLIPKPMLRAQKRRARINLVMLLAIAATAYLIIDRFVQGLVR